MYSWSTIICNSEEAARRYFAPDDWLAGAVGRGAFNGCGSRSRPQFFGELAAASGWARAILRLEGAAAFAASAALYAHGGFSWPLFAVLFLAPDLAMLGYLAGAPDRRGAPTTSRTPTRLALPLALFGFLAGAPAVLAVALIWIAHIGFDRALGYGLKYPTGFGDTHLGRIGRG